MVDPEWERSGESNFGRKTTPEEEVKREAFFLFLSFSPSGSNKQVSRERWIAKRESKMCKSSSATQIG